MDHINGTMTVQDKTVQHSVRLLEQLLRYYRPLNFGIRLWDGRTWHPETGIASKFTLIIRHPSLLRKMLWKVNELSLAEAFISGELDVEGDLEQAVPLAEYLLHSHMTWGDRLRFGLKLLSLPSSRSSNTDCLAATLTGAYHSLSRDKQAIAHHYEDRKSTRLNSSHQKISYAVFCLKKK